MKSIKFDTDKGYSVTYAKNGLLSTLPDKSSSVQRMMKFLEGRLIKNTYMCSSLLWFETENFQNYLNNFSMRICKKFFYCSIKNIYNLLPLLLFKKKKRKKIFSSFSLVGGGYFCKLYNIFFFFFSRIGRRRKIFSSSSWKAKEENNV